MLHIYLFDFKASILQLQLKYSLQLKKIDLQGEDIAGLDVTTLEELQNFHVEAITKICHAKVISLVISFWWACWPETEF